MYSACVHALSWCSNPCSLGAALVVDTHTAVPDVYSQLLHNPLCVLLYENRTQPPDQWENVCSVVLFCGSTMHKLCIIGHGQF